MQVYLGRHRQELAGNATEVLVLGRVAQGSTLEEVLLFHIEKPRQGQDNTWEGLPISPFVRTTFEQLTSQRRVVSFQ